MGVERVAAWERFGWLRHGFSTRLDGFSTVYGGHDLNLGFTADDDPETVRANRAKFLAEVAGDASFELVTLRQIHGTEVRAVAADETGVRSDDGRALIAADGLMTAAAGVMLGVQAADCVPILVADTRLRVVAGFHSGWRGTAAGMVERGIAGMSRDFGSRPEDLVAAVGPAIGACCYTVGEEVRSAFEQRFRYAEQLFSPDMRLNLAEANRRQILDSGLRTASVTVLAECSACTRIGNHRKYFSHRAERGVTGRAMGMIGVVAD